MPGVGLVGIHKLRANFPGPHLFMKVIPVNLSAFMARSSNFGVYGLSGAGGFFHPCVGRGIRMNVIVSANDNPPVGKLAAGLMRYGQKIARVKRHPYAKAKAFMQA